MDTKIELIHLPVADVDRAKAFYEQAGWVVDHDHAISEELRFVQVTPPGSACSITIGQGLTGLAPGSLDNLQAVVADADEALRDLTERGIAAEGVDGPAVGPVRLVRRPRRQPVDAPADRVPGQLTSSPRALITASSSAAPRVTASRSVATSVAAGSTPSLAASSTRRQIPAISSRPRLEALPRSEWACWATSGADPASVAAASAVTPVPAMVPKRSTIRATSAESTPSRSISSLMRTSAGLGGSAGGSL